MCSLGRLFFGGRGTQVEVVYRTSKNKEKKRKEKPLPFFPRFLFNRYWLFSAEPIRHFITRRWAQGHRCWTGYQDSLLGQAFQTGGEKHTHAADSR